MVEQHIKPLLPATTLTHLQPWFKAAEGVLAGHGNGLSKWPDKVRVLPKGFGCGLTAMKLSLSNRCVCGVSSAKLLKTWRVSTLTTVKDRQVFMSQPKELNASMAVAAFLDDPETLGKSAISLQFLPVANLQSVPDALFYITKAGPSPFLLCQCGTVDSKEVAVASLGGPTELVFSRQPPTGNKERDLAEILEWFETANIAVDLMQRSVTEWYPQQFTGAPFWKGLSVDSGWVQIVDAACSEVQSTLTAEELREFHWLQIKQENAGFPSTQARCRHPD